MTIAYLNGLLPILFGAIIIGAIVLIGILVGYLTLRFVRAYKEK